MKNKNLLNSIHLVLMLFTLSACISKSLEDCVNFSCVQQHRQNYICTNAELYLGKIVGDGHCVSLIKHCSGAPNTKNWLPGQTVWNNTIQPGTIIATFKDGYYPNISGYHAAIYIKQDTNGIWVWDQWQGKPVHKRLIRWRKDKALDSNTAQSYQVVQSIKSD